MQTIASIFLSLRRFNILIGTHNAIGFLSILFGLELVADPILQEYRQLASWIEALKSTSVNVQREAYDAIKFNAWRPEFSLKIKEAYDSSKNVTQQNHLKNLLEHLYQEDIRFERFILKSRRSTLYTVQKLKLYRYLRNEAFQKTRSQKDLLDAILSNLDKETRDHLLKLHKVRVAALKKFKKICDRYGSRKMPLETWATLNTQGNIIEGNSKLSTSIMAGLVADIFDKKKYGEKAYKAVSPYTNDIVSCFQHTKNYFTGYRVRVVRDDRQHEQLQLTYSTTMSTYQRWQFTESNEKPLKLTARDSELNLKDLNVTVDTLGLEYDPTQLGYRISIGYFEKVYDPHRYIIKNLGERLLPGQELDWNKTFGTEDLPKVFSKTLKWHRMN